MGLFGNKNNDKKNNVNPDEVDLDLLGAIEEADAQMEEERQAKIAERQRAAEEAKAANEAKAKVTLEEIKRVLPNDGRRAYMMVTECVEATETFVKVKGKLFGNLKANDVVFIYRPGGTVIEAKATVIAPVAEEIAEDNVPETVEAVVNSPVVLTLEVNALTVGVIPEKIAVFGAVISTVKPQTVLDTRFPAENPALFGTSLAYNDYKDNKEYLSILFRHVATAKFIVPSHIDNTRINEKGQPGRKIIMLKTKEEDMLLPLFTDVPSLTKWKEIFQEETKPALVIMTFPDVVKFVEESGLDIIINSSGPVGIRMPNSLIKTFAASKSYQQQFGSKPKYTKETIKEEAAKIAVGPVPASPETNAIKNVIKSFGAAHPEIDSIGVLAMRRNGVNGYLIIVDCPKAVCRELFADLRSACAPHMVAIKEMNFSLYAETMFADQYFADHAFDYVKNPNL